MSKINTKDSYPEKLPAHCNKGMVGIQLVEAA
jgi:hypothetical protein